MQATVLSFDPETSGGTVVTDDGHTVEFDAAAFSRGGLRLLRPGQRVRAQMSASGVIEEITVHTLPERQQPDRQHRAG